MKNGNILMVASSLNIKINNKVCIKSQKDLESKVATEIMSKRKVGR